MNKLPAKHVGLLCLAAIQVSELAFAQGTISTVAGGTGAASGFVDNVPATQSPLTGLQGIAVDLSGNFFIGESYRIRRVDGKSGIISTVAGNGTSQPAGDGPATQIGVIDPRYFHIDASGNLLFFDCNIRKLNLNAGTVQTLVQGDCSGTGGPLGSVSGFGVDTAGNFYVSDDYGGFVRRIDGTSGAITVIAGNGQIANGQSPAGDGGAATSAPLSRPHDVVVDPSGNVYFGESYFIRRVDAQTGLISTVAGGTSAPISPGPMACDRQGNIYFYDANQVREIILPAGTIAVVAGTGNPNYAGDGIPATQANISLSNITVDSAGDLWIADAGNARVFEVSAGTGLIHSVAGVYPNGDGGPAIGASLFTVTGLALSAQGDLYLSSGTAIRRVDHATGTISTYVANLQNPGPLAFDHQGVLYVSAGNGVFRVDPSSGAVSFTGVGGAGIAFDMNDNLVVAGPDGSTVQRVDALTGVVTTIAGNGQPNTPYSQSGIATEIPIGAVYSVAFGPDNLLYMTIPGGILRLDANGIISRIAGGGLGGACLQSGPSYSGDGGLASLSSLCGPGGLTFDSDGNYFVADSGCSCIRRIAAGTGIIQTVAGNGVSGTSSDSVPALSAALAPGLTAWWGGDLYFVDGQPSDLTSRIRKLSPPTPLPLPQPPHITGLLNAADFSFFNSPGGITSLFGNYLAGATTLASVQIGADGKVTTSLAGTQLLFDSIPAPLLYVSPGQINAVVPYGARIAPYGITVDLDSGNGTDSLTDYVLQPNAPGIFGGLVFNPDGTINSISNPAPKGATVVVYGTGMGQTTPAGVDGAIVQGPTLPTPVAQFSGGPDEEIIYVGAAPGFVSGLMQANIQMSATLLPGPSGLELLAVSYVPALNKYVGNLTQPLTVYMLSDPPVITGINPPSPQIILANTNSLTVDGSYFNGPMTAEFFYNGVQAPASQFLNLSTSATALSFTADFKDQSGQWSVDVVNAANQRSNRFNFVVLPPGPPSITSILGQVFATSGPQLIYVNGINFDPPLSVDVFYNDVKITTLSGAQIMPISGPDLFSMTIDFKGVAGSYAIEVVDGRGLQSNYFDFTVYPAMQ